MTADPVRPQETLRAVAQALHRADCGCSASWADIREDGYYLTLAAAVLPIVEEETARQLGTLRDKVKALADEWVNLARNVRSRDRDYNVGWIDAMYRCADDIYSIFGDDETEALVEEPQGGEQ